MTLKGKAAEAPLGLLTVTWAIPAAATSGVVMEAVSCVLLTNVVLRLLPSQFTVELAVKLDPLTVNANAAPPAMAFAGRREVTTGPVEAVTVSACATATPPKEA